MHTFIKRSNVNYEVGLWVPNVNGGASFQAVVSCISMMRAIQTVNLLNGGPGAEDGQVNYLKLREID